MKKMFTMGLQDRKKSHYNSLTKIYLVLHIMNIDASQITYNPGILTFQLLGHMKN